MESSSMIVRTEKIEPEFDSVEGTQHAVSLDKHGLEKLNPVKIEQGINQALEEKVVSLEKEIDELKRGRLFDKQVIEELNIRRLESEHREAEQGLKELRARVSNLEVEKKVSGLIMEVLKQEKSEADAMLKESERRSSEKLLELQKEIDLLKRSECSENKILDKLKTELSESMIREFNLREKHSEAMKELQARVLNLEDEKRTAGMIIEELRRGKLEADEVVKESRKRSLEACETVKVSIRRLENVVPIAESFFKLLKMNVGDLVEMKNMLAREEEGTNEHGMTGQNVVVPSDTTRNSNRGQKRGRSGAFGGDIVRAFQEDDELCIQAVCKLYRHVSDSECLCDKRFDHFEELWRRELADYLMQRDPDVLRSIVEVKQLFPHIVDLCRQLALEYSSYFTALPWGEDENEPQTLSVSLVCCGCEMLIDTQDVGACETDEET